MRVLLVGPSCENGSISPYMSLLAGSLAQQGARVTRVGCDCLPYDAAEGRFWSLDRIVAKAEGLWARVPEQDHDLISLQFGNLEIEQLLAAFWARHTNRPAVYHVHSMNWTLFREHVPNPELQDAVRRGVCGMNGYLCFGSFARAYCASHWGAKPIFTSFYPMTIPACSTPLMFRELGNFLGGAGRRLPLATLYGFASPWKNANLLVQALSLVREPMCFLLAGPLWSDASSCGIELEAARRVLARGAVRFSVVDRYLSSGEAKALLQASDFGVFPYRYHDSFQGSGALADYLGHGVPVVATDVGNLREMVGSAGIVVPSNDPLAMAAAISRLAGDAAYRQRLRLTAEKRAALFDAERHGAGCLAFYQSLTA